MKRRGTKRGAWSVERGAFPHATRNTQHAPTAPRSTLHVPSRAFTLIELMVVVAIMGIVMTIAIPTIYHQFHPDSMRKAVEDVMDACREARARAILNGAATDLVIRPGDRQIEIRAGAASAPAEHQLFSPD